MVIKIYLGEKAKGLFAKNIFGKEKGLSCVLERKEPTDRDGEHVFVHITCARVRIFVSLSISCWYLIPKLILSRGRTFKK